MWPAFISEEDLRALRHRVRVQKSVAGARVRLLDAAGVAVEYVRLRTGAFQRVEGGALPKFPSTLAPSDLASNAMPYAVTAAGPGRVEVAEAASGRRALYVPAGGGGWRRLLDA